jgi:hypothetical protein
VLTLRDGTFSEPDCVYLAEKRAEKRQREANFAGHSNMQYG